MIWAFLAGMVCGAALLITLIVISDRSFLDLISGQVSGEGSAERVQTAKRQAVRTLAAGGDS